MRTLTKAEYGLISFLLMGTPYAKQIISGLSNMMVEEMDDGGMGSLRFMNKNMPQRRFGKQISEITLLDEDKVPVSFAIFLDKDGKLFELNVFKADFSRLVKFPTPPYVPLGKAPPNERSL
jgi:hypothetical protein